ncbi:hypothetical protein GGI07_002735 [Coemansia sp. Benny D115]|nr:hypothetical protein GGI07_002735 [Coemansia sp. Benny D115]
MAPGPADSDACTKSASTSATTLTQGSNRTVPPPLAPLAPRMAAEKGASVAASAKPASVAKGSSTGGSQILRNINVAGVTVEVVRHDSTIIYRLPGNMPVSALTPEQRTRVMQEIQKIRSTSNTRGARPTPAQQQQQQQQQPGRPAGAVPGRPPPKKSLVPAAGGTSDNPRLARLHPALPSIAPRPQMPTTTATAGGLATPPSAPVSAPASASAAATPMQGKTGLVSQQPLRAAMSSSPRPPGVPAPRRQPPDTPPASAGPTTQQSALEKMYQSAYLRLLNGPAKVLRRLSPPVELSSIVGRDVDGALAPAVLLRVLKALTKAQAAQLAAMHDQQLKLAKTEPVSQRSSPVGSQASSREPSPETDAAPRKRKYTKTGKYSVKKPMRSCDVSEPAVFTHADLVRRLPPPLAERRKAQETHEAEVARRFRDALAMDHQMVQNPDWHTPFRGPRDVVQRLLPFHVLQCPDNVLDAAIAREEESLAASTSGLATRLDALSKRYRRLLVAEGESGFCAVDGICLERACISDARQQIDQFHEAQLQRDISILAPSANTENSR